MTPFLKEPGNDENAEALTALFAAVRRSRQLAGAAKANLEASIATLVRAVQTGSGQGRRIEELLWSCWNGQNKTGLCDSLTGLDSAIAEAAIAMLAARAHLGGDADYLLRQIIDQSGSQPPAENADPEKYPQNPIPNFPIPSI